MGFGILGLLGLALLSSLFVDGDDGDSASGSTTSGAGAEEEVPVDVTVGQEPEIPITPPVQQPETSGSTQRGDAGADLLIGGEGTDNLFGQGGDDALIGGADGDRIFGGGGADEILGQGGEDFLRGGPGDDRIFAGTGEDIVKGDAGNDRIIAIDTVDEDLIVRQILGLEPAFLPADVILDLNAETKEGDTIEGGSGLDRIIIGSNDEATGGSEADRFDVGEWIDPAEPALITDFTPSEDILFYYHEGDEPVLDFEDDGNGNTTLLADGDAVVIFRGLEANQLSTANIFTGTSLD